MSLTIRPHQLYPFDITLEAEPFNVSGGTSTGYRIVMNGETADLGKAAIYDGDKGPDGDPGDDGECRPGSTGCCQKKPILHRPSPLVMDGKVIANDFISACIVNYPICEYLGRCEYMEPPPEPAPTGRPPDPPDDPPAPPDPPEEPFPPKPVQPPS